MVNTKVPVSLSFRLRMAEMLMLVEAANAIGMTPSSYARRIVRLHIRGKQRVARPTTTALVMAGPVKEEA